MADNIRTCGNCQNHDTLQRTSSSIGFSADICNLPEVDGFKHLIVAIDYFSKWPEAKPIKEKSVPTVAAFLYELICRHGYFSIQINDQGREFVNTVAGNLHQTTGAEQRVTSAYHRQSNGLCEKQNRTIKNPLAKVLNNGHTSQKAYYLHTELVVILQLCFTHFV